MRKISPLQKILVKFDGSLVTHKAQYRNINGALFVATRFDGCDKVPRGAVGDQSLWLSTT